MDTPRDELYDIADLERWLAYCIREYAGGQVRIPPDAEFEPFVMNVMRGDPEVVVTVEEPPT